MNLRLSALALLCSLIPLGTPLLAHAAASTSPTAFESSIITLTNTDRVSQGEAPLATSTLLARAAQKKADDMLANSYFAHISPLGVTPWYWFTKVGYYYSHAGENLAVHFDDATALEAAWMASPGHRANILKGVYTQIGIGVAHGMYQGEPTTFVVELFATPAAAVAVR